jgi:transcriptional antiterminator NusG
MMDKKLERLWYVLHTKSRHENVVNDGLLKKSMEVFLPQGDDPRAPFSRLFVR